MAGIKPVTATVFAYQVGFGDCFLVRFDYSDASRRHMLIDFGTTKLPENAPDGHMMDVAQDIATKCGGKLDVLVATHRHADHISGFATKAGQGTGDVIKSLKPKVVIQPWTEAPDAPEDWLGPEISASAKAFSGRRKSLAAMHKVSDQIVKGLESGGIRAAPAVAAELQFIGEDNLANLSAVKNLMEMGKAGRAVYGFHGCQTGLGAELPGMEVHVLGPPTLLQSEAIRKEASSNVDEFWQLAPKRFADATLLPDQKPRLFPAAPFDPATRLPTEQRWVAERIDSANAEQLLGLVRALDDQMNNTSLILVFKAGTKTLLFPGDAQIENWQYALEHNLDLLKSVDLYKVGHHGSRNATPKTLWGCFHKKSTTPGAGRLKSVMSTLSGKHGSIKNKSEVPRQPLVTELKRYSDLHSTEGMMALCDTVVIDLT